METKKNSVEGVKETIRNGRIKKRTRYQKVCNITKSLSKHSVQLNDNQLKCSRCGGFREPEEFEKGSKNASNLREGRSYNCKVCLMFDRTWQNVEAALEAGISKDEIIEGLNAEMLTPKLKIEATNKAIEALELGMEKGE